MRAKIPYHPVKKSKKIQQSTLLFCILTWLSVQLRSQHATSHFNYIFKPLREENYVNT